MKCEHLDQFHVDSGKGWKFCMICQEVDKIACRIVKAARKYLHGRPCGSCKGGRINCDYCDETGIDPAERRFERRIANLMQPFYVNNHDGSIRRGGTWLMMLHDPDKLKRVKGNPARP